MSTLTSKSIVHLSLLSLFLLTLAPGCRFQSIMRKAMRAFLGVLAEYTLDDLVRDKERMCGLLDLEIPVATVSEA